MENAVSMKRKTSQSYDKLWLGKVLQKQLWLDIFTLAVKQDM